MQPDSHLNSPCFYAHAFSVLLPKEKKTLNLDHQVFVAVSRQSVRDGFLCSDEEEVTIIVRHCVGFAAL